jgi:hypothetical protein
MMHPSETFSDLPPHINLQFSSGVLFLKNDSSEKESKLMESTLNIYSGGLTLKRLIYLPILLLLIAGCKTVSLVSVNPEFKTAQGRSLLLMPVPSSAIYISNKDDVADDFSEDKRDPELVLRDSLYLGMISNAEESVVPGVSIEWMDSTEFSSLRDTSNYLFLHVKGDQGNITATYFVPRKKWLIAHGAQPDLVLSIKKISFSRNQEYSAGHFTPGVTVSTPHGSFTTGGAYVSGGGTLSLGAQFEFMIYDYKNNMWVAYGISEASSYFLFAMTRGDWDAIFHSIVREAVSGCPALEKPREY